MVWGLFCTSGPGCIAIIERKIESQVYQNILQENIKQYAWQWNLNSGGVT